jgi:hypothetical protein
MMTSVPQRVALSTSVPWVEIIELQTAAIVAAVDCPYCGVSKGRDCKTAANKLSWQAHKDRRFAWRTSLQDKYGEVTFEFTED